MLKQKEAPKEAPVVTPENKLKTDYLALKQEHSELGRLYELRGRSLATAQKRADKADDIEAALREAETENVQLSKTLATTQREVEDLQAKLARANDILDDVAALKRLAG